MQSNCLTDWHSLAAYGELTVLQNSIIVSALPLRTAVNSPDEFGLTLLHSAVSGTVDGAVIDWLVDSGADVNAITSTGLTALHMAAGAGADNVVRSLIARNATVNAADFHRKTPLHYASSNDHDNVVATLLAHGADATLTDDRGLSALNWMQKFSQNDVATTNTQSDPRLDALFR